MCFASSINTIHRMLLQVLPPRALALSSVYQTMQLVLKGHRAFAPLQGSLDVPRPKALV